MVKAKTRVPECAVYIAPPEHKPPLRAYLPRLRVIEASDHGGLQGFVQALIQRRSGL